MPHILVSWIKYVPIVNQAPRLLSSRVPTYMYTLVTFSYLQEST